MSCGWVKGKGGGGWMEESREREGGRERFIGEVREREQAEGIFERCEMSRTVISQVT